jgi:hypothetical protein
MGIQPATLQEDLTPASASTDFEPPNSTIHAPADGAILPREALIIRGDAVDRGGGRVAGVEVSVDNGDTWHPADGRETWSFEWVPAETGTATILSRAVDDSGNLEQPGKGVTVTIVPQK